MLSITTEWKKKGSVGIFKTLSPKKVLIAVLDETVMVPAFSNSNFPVMVFVVDLLVVVFSNPTFFATAVIKFAEDLMWTSRKFSEIS